MAHRVWLGVGEGRAPPLGAIASRHRLEASLETCPLHLRGILGSKRFRARALQRLPGPLPLERQLPCCVLLHTIA